MSGRLVRWGLLLGAACAAGGAAEGAAGDGTSLVERWRLETHGFVSFGWIDTRGNDWYGDTEGGTAEFHEAALNALARPIERVRLGVQLFSRDLGRYDDGRVQLDWAYADWRVADAFGLRAGRVKFPFGLANDVRDVDAARTPVFLPVSLYAQRTRDLYLSVDGGLAYGFVDAGAAGACEWSLFAGRKHIERASSTAESLGDDGLGAPVTDVDIDWAWGAMVHWDTPIAGLGARLSWATLKDMTVTGDAGPATMRTRIGHYGHGVASLVWERGDLTIAAEYGRIHGRGEVRVDGVRVGGLRDDAHAGYISATWRQRPWLEWYLAGENGEADPGPGHARRAVAAVAVRPLPHWALKAEVQQVEGTLGILPADNPGGADHHWQVYALKTTVDF